MRLVDTSGNFTFRKILMANRPSAHRPGLSAESISKQSKSVRTLPVHFICREMVGFIQNFDSPYLGHLRQNDGNNSKEVGV